MKILVLGGTGTVGSQVVRDLLDRKIDTYILTRDAQKAAQLPAGAHGVVGDLLDPQTIRTAFQGMDGLFLLNAVATSEANEGLMAVNGAMLGGVGKIVYISVQHVDRAPHLPHFGAKLGVEAAIRSCGIRFTILRPNNFYQNDIWLKDVILRYGIYPQPIGPAGISRVDVRDISEVAVHAFTDGGHDGQTYDVVGPEPMTGASTAAAWSQALGRAVAYGGDDVDAWEKQAVQFYPAWMAFDFRRMYEFFQKQGLKGTAEDIARLTRIMGHAPRSFAAYAAECAKAWT